MPRNGRTRLAVRLSFVDTVVDDETGELAYAEVKDEDGEIIQQRASRKVRRSVAFGTRLHNDGKPWRESRDKVKPRAFAVRGTTNDDEDWLDVIALADQVNP